MKTENTVTFGELYSINIRRIQKASSFAEASADRSICKTSAGIILGSKELGRTSSSALKSFGGPVVRPARKPTNKLARRPAGELTKLPAGEPAILPVDMLMGKADSWREVIFGLSRFV